MTTAERAPLVSVLVPCFNGARWLAAALDSALQQTWKRLEVIVVDDGSTDDSAEVARQFAPFGVRLIQRPRRGASAARNAALSEARGDYIQFLDADDVLGASKIEGQVRALEAAGACSVASCAWARFEADPREAVFHREAVWRSQPALDFLVRCALDDLMFPCHAWLLPRRLCEAAGSWDEQLSLNDDGEYLARVLAPSAGIVFCATERVYYRTNHAASYSRQATAEAARSDLRAWNSIAATMRSIEDTEVVRQAIATGYQRLKARYYPSFPDIWKAAARLESEHGGGIGRLEGGGPFHAARALFGWRIALLLRGLKAKWRAAKPERVGQ